MIDGPGTAPDLGDHVMEPTLRLSAAAANANLDIHTDARWYANGIDVTDAGGPYAVQRLRQEVFEPAQAPAWTRDHRIPAGAKAFAIGSCFARGVESQLRADGFDVLSWAPEFDAFETINPNVTGRGFTNKYTAFAIENELRWALDPSASFPLDSLVEMRPGVALDPHAHHTLKLTDRDGTLERRKTIAEVFGRVAECEVIVITLGLVEAWYDSQASCLLNMAPRAKQFELFPDRYEFVVTSFAQNRAALDGISDLIARFGHPEAHVFVTVSPVPLMATFSGRDVVAANAYSKAVLRAAAEEWSLANERVHYFPSYEIVTNSATEAAWEDDLRHVRGPIVGQITAQFANTYLET